MRKIIILGLALSLAGCASERQFVQDHLHHTKVAVPAVPSPLVVPAVAPVVVPAPVVTPLGKPRWYDEFRSGVKKVKSKLHKKGK